MRLQFSPADAIHIAHDSSWVSPQTQQTNKQLCAKVCHIYQSSEFFPGCTIISQSKTKFQPMLWLNQGPFFQKLFEKVVEEVKKDVTVKVTNEIALTCFGGPYYEWWVENKCSTC